MATQDNNPPINFDFFICGWAWQRDLLSVKQQILDAEPQEAVRLLDELVARFDPERGAAEPA